MRPASGAGRVDLIVAVDALPALKGGDSVCAAPLWAGHFRGFLLHRAVPLTGVGGLTCPPQAFKVSASPERLGGFRPAATGKGITW